MSAKIDGARNWGLGGVFTVTGKIGRDVENCVNDMSGQTGLLHSVGTE